MPPNPSKSPLEKIEQLQEMHKQTRATTSEVQLEIIRQQLGEYRRALASRKAPPVNRSDSQRLLLEEKIKALEGILADNEPLIRMFALIRDTQRNIDRDLEVAKRTGEFSDDFHTKTLPQMRQVFKVQSQVELHYISFHSQELVRNWSKASWQVRGLLLQRLVTIAPLSCMRMVSVKWVSDARGVEGRALHPPYFKIELLELRTYSIPVNTLPRMDWKDRANEKLEQQLKDLNRTSEVELRVEIVRQEIKEIKRKLHGQPSKSQGQLHRQNNHHNMKLETFFDHFSSTAALALHYNPTTNTANTTSADVLRQGWTSAPNRRGTFDILWSCISTWVLCCWSMLCLNIPAPRDTTWAIFKRKTVMFAFLLFGPEIYGAEVAGQYLSARQSVKDFAAAGIDGWTLSYAYLANMGGYVLQTSDWVPFPVDAKQLLWLVRRGFVAVPDIRPEAIKDKNKVDGVIRLIMVAQTLWFMANFFGRIAQGLTITVLELTTAAFVYCALPIMWMWRHKPADVGMPEFIHTDARMAEILLAGGDEVPELYLYDRTPLDFISRKEWFWSIYWSHAKHLLYRLHLSGPRARPVDRFSNTSSPEVAAWLWNPGLFFALSFGAIFIAPWHFSFPTEAERLLWRISSVTYVVTMAAGELVTRWAFEWLPYLRDWWGALKSGRMPAESESETEIEKPEEEGQKNPRRRPPQNVWELLRNTSPGQDPLLAAPLKAILPMHILVLGYLLARAYILVEDFLELRSLPASAYQTVEWGQLIPHIG
ncbi:MAG: hypothetical protein Q9208_002571 [Pyrenodesmia sp. 3 TL-2023]